MLAATRSTTRRLGVRLSFSAVKGLILDHMLLEFLAVGIPELSVDTFRPETLSHRVGHGQSVVSIVVNEQALAPETEEARK